MKETYELTIDEGWELLFPFPSDFDRLTAIQKIELLEIKNGGGQSLNQLLMKNLSQRKAKYLDFFPSFENLREKAKVAGINRKEFFT
ncbi:hypothetical protein FIV31_04440 [Coxiella endosymbiont of Ornithodoros amblus]|uniref:hypothetical protein n=1 Tax=Coxiella endosymbiont of Ornithodoros amblus TaxID=1656166 RepID=UPI00244E0369|nr:hypothetical protein [Coxiella endosymbiont of Ornithodoros amblus]MBW5802750.1 hypothetical protein [Coxiella endosymbiont of Ornithodoros amblus]